MTVKKAADGIKYPFISLWCHIMGSYAYYRELQKEDADQFDLDWLTTSVATTASHHLESSSGLHDVKNLNTLDRMRYDAAQRGWLECVTAISEQILDVQEEMRENNG